MSVIKTTKFTERMSRRLRRADRKEWVGESSGDAWGRFLIFQIGGKCLAGAGWTRAECEQIVHERILGAAGGPLS